MTAASDSAVERSLSVSSTRKTKVPPWWRAKAQLKRAVRTRPTCGEPVGEGAIRTRTVTALHSFLGHHRVRQRAQDRARNLYFLSHLHRADARRRAGQDHV